MTWQDLLAGQVRELEAKVEGFDPTIANEARVMLRSLRGFELRVRQVALRADHRGLFRTIHLAGR
jgi:hypothetical protein